MSDPMPEFTSARSEDGTVHLLRRTPTGYVWAGTLSPPEADQINAILRYAAHAAQEREMAGPPPIASKGHTPPNGLDAVPDEDIDRVLAHPSGEVDLGPPGRGRKRPANGKDDAT